MVVVCGVLSPLLPACNINQDLAMITSRAVTLQTNALAEQSMFMMKHVDLPQSRRGPLPLSDFVMGKHVVDRRNVAVGCEAVRQMASSGAIGIRASTLAAHRRQQAAGRGARTHLELLHAFSPLDREQRAAADALSPEGSC